MKRIIVLLVATFMLLGMVAVVSVAAPEVPTISVTDARGNRGDEVKVSVQVAGNPGVIAMGLKIGYDSNLLELKSATGKDYSDVSFGPLDGNPFRFSWEDVLKPNSTQNGTIVELTFLIKAGATYGNTDVTVTYDADNVFNSNYENVSFQVQKGTVTIARVVSGVSIDKTLEVAIGEKKTPQVTVSPADADNKAVSFESSDKTVATVSASGEVTGVARGEARITVKTEDGGFTDTCVVTVICVHANKTRVPEQGSSCAEKGWDAYDRCNTCGQLFKIDGSECAEVPYRPLLEHQSGDWIVDQAATCGAAGSKHTECTVCHQTLKTESIEPTGHAYSEWSLSKEPSCTEAGAEKRVCAKCGHEETQSIEALGHDYSADWTIDKEATCTEKGSKSHHCSRCDSVTDVTEIPLTDHVPGEWIVDKTPEIGVKGKAHKECVNCHTILEEADVPELPEDFDESESIDVKEEIKKAGCGSIVNGVWIALLISVAGVFIMRGKRKTL